MSRSPFPLARPVLYAGLLACAATPARAQAPPPGRATFFVLARSDTIAAERVARTADALTGDLLVRIAGTRVTWEATLAPDGLVSRFTMRVFRPAGDTAAAQVVELAFAGDSLRMRGTSRTATQSRTIAIPPGALPYVNPSPGIIEQIARRARSLGDSSTVPLVDVGSGQTFPAIVRWASRDSATLSLGGVAIAVVVDSAGRLQSFAVPSQGVRTVRVEGDRSFGVATRDYSAPADAPYTAEAVRVRTPAGLTLGGTLTLPRDAAQHPVPAVVTITGSGLQDRDGSTPMLPADYRIFRDIADTLSRRGIAVLRLDDRGAGESEPGPPQATSADFADDIEAALAYLRTRPDIDARRLGLVGHSEGGAIAPMVAARDSGVRAIVLLAGPGKRGLEVSMDQNRDLVARASGLTAGQRDSILAAARAKLDSMQHERGWIGFWLGYDPLATARRVRRAHVLILQGATDRQVLAAQAKTLAGAFRAGGNRDVTVRVFPATDHLFLTDSSGDPAKYGTLPDRHVRRDVLAVMSDWLAREMAVSPALPLRK